MRVTTFISRPYDILVTQELLAMRNLEHANVTAIIPQSAKIPSAKARRFIEDRLPDWRVVNLRHYGGPEKARVPSIIVPSGVLFPYQARRIWLALVRKSLIGLAPYFWARAENAIEESLQSSPLRGTDVFVASPAASKLLLLHPLSPGELVVVDGGRSTVSQGFDRAALDGGRSGLVRAGLGFQGTGMSRRLREKTLSSIPIRTSFFTCYLSSQVCGDLRIVHNDFGRFRSLIGEKYSSNCGFILGTPSDEVFAQGERRLGRELMADSSRTWYYYPHPRETFNQLRAEFCAENNVALADNIYGFELDLIAAERLPSRIISFGSSAADTVAAAGLGICCTEISRIWK